MDTHTLATRLARQHHISPDYAERSVEDLVRQIERVDERRIDHDDINADDAQFVTGAFAASLANDDNGRTDLTDELIAVADRLRDAQADADTLADERNELVLRLWAHGATVRAIVEASGLNQSRVYAIIHDDKQDKKKEA